MSSAPHGYPAILGFDARESWLSLEPLWTRERQEQYLLRHPKDRPLSADPMAWPSIFDTGEMFAICDADAELDGWRGLKLPPWPSIGLNTPLWNDASQLCEYVRESWPFSGKPVSLVALTVPDAHTLTSNEGWPYVQDTNPPEIDRAWHFVGFDVLADQSTISGLMNCGYGHEERRYAQERWASKLNRNHLFQSQSDASDFSEWRNESVAEHAPFFIAGLYSMGTIETQSKN